MAIAFSIATSIGGLSAVAAAVAVAGGIAFNIGVVVVTAGTGSGSAFGTTLGAMGISFIVIVSIIVAGIFGDIAGFVALAAASTGCFVIINWLLNLAVRRRRLGLFFASSLVAMTSGSVLAPFWFSRMSLWPVTGPLLMFGSLLAFINIPFDWCSIGLTRALLRLGVERQGWWPYILAAVDAALALIIAALLLLCLVVSAQAFDLSAILGRGRPVLQLEPLFTGLTAAPGDPAYWWIYALLLSTLIPSIANLLIGAVSLTHGIPGLSDVLLHFMPVGFAVPTFDRTWIAAVLTAQWAIGLALVLAAFAFLGWLASWLVPDLGTWFLDYARAVAALDVPGRVVALFRGG